MSPEILQSNLPEHRATARPLDPANHRYRPPLLLKHPKQGLYQTISFFRTLYNDALAGSNQSISNIAGRKRGAGRSQSIEGKHITRIDGIAAALQALGEHLDMRVVGA